jgi:hypothetical protein
MSALPERANGSAAFGRRACTRSKRRRALGSATLRADRNAAGAEEDWAAVLSFLGKFGAVR